MLFVVLTEGRGAHEKYFRVYCTFIARILHKKADVSVCVCVYVCMCACVCACVYWRLEVEAAFEAIVSVEQPVGHERARVHHAVAAQTVDRELQAAQSLTSADNTRDTRATDVILPELAALDLAVRARAARNAVRVAVAAQRAPTAARAQTACVARTQRNRVA